MLDELALILPPLRTQELESRLRSRNDQTVPTEWEIAIGFALSKVGKIIDPGIELPGNPDYFFEAPDSNKKIVIEVTTLSDKNIDKENPVDEFIERLRKIMIKEGIVPGLGSYGWSIGDIEIDDRIILGVPDHTKLDSFFREPSFKNFLKSIKESPSVEHLYEFKARGACSVISYMPGRKNVSCTHRSYKVARTLTNSSVLNRLRNKERQLSRANIGKLPSILFLCDNNSHLLKHLQMNSPNTYNIDDIVSALLDGRQQWQEGPFIIQKGIKKYGNKIHAVITLTTHRLMDFLSNHGRYELRGRIIPASYCDDYILSPEFISIINAAIAQLPIPVRTPNNAMRVSKWPAHFGGGSMTANTIKISLLTLQKLLSGEISYDEFAESHGSLATQLKNLDMRGFMISNIKIDPQNDADDDWVTLSYDGLQPDRLFNIKRQK
ncbi:hypothetical protein [Methylomagnum sp.]